MVKRLASIILLAVFLTVLGVAALATTTLVSVADGTSAITSGAHSISLGRTFSSVIVFTDSAAPTCNINFNHGVAASSSDPPITAGSGVGVGLGMPIPPTDQINYNAGASTGNISWYAWNR